jgi:proline iminopeptidase
VLYDQVGSGKSKQIKRQRVDVGEFVKQLDHVVRKLDISEFHLYGTSWGATLALEFYKYKQGEGIKSLILSSPLISEPVWSKDAKQLINLLPKKNAQIIKICEKYGLTDSHAYKKAMEDFYSRFVFKYLKNRENVFKTLFKGFNPQIYESMWGVSEFSATGKLKGYEGTTILKKIKCPVLLLCGQDDESTPASNKKFSQIIKNCQFVVVPKASHLTLLENQKFTLSVIKSFLKNVEQNPKSS